MPCLAWPSRAGKVRPWPSPTRPDTRFKLGLPPRKWMSWPVSGPDIRFSFAFSLLHLVLILLSSCPYLALILLILLSFAHHGVFIILHSSCFIFLSLCLHLAWPGCSPRILRAQHARDPPADQETRPPEHWADSNPPGAGPGFDCGTEPGV